MFVVTRLTVVILTTGESVDLEADRIEDALENGLRQADQVVNPFLLFLDRGLPGGELVVLLYDDLLKSGDPTLVVLPVRAAPPNRQHRHAEDQGRRAAQRAGSHE